MMNPRALKAFVFAFLLILAGGLVFIGSAPLGLSNNPANPSAASIDLPALALILLGLFVGLIACFI